MLCFVFVIVGLSLVSMCINVVQVALEDFYCQLLMKLIMEYQQKLAEGAVAGNLFYLIQEVESWERLPECSSSLETTKPRNC